MRAIFIIHMRNCYCFYKGRILCSASRRITATLSHVEAMAESPDPSDKVLDELEKDITCAVCCGHYQEAKLLPCNHYYCRACISLGPRPFSNFFHTHAQQRGRGERKGSGDTAYPSADPGMSTILICGYYSSVRARVRPLL